MTSNAPCPINEESLLATCRPVDKQAKKETPVDPPSSAEEEMSERLMSTSVSDSSTSEGSMATSKSKDYLLDAIELTAFALRALNEGCEKMGAERLTQALDSMKKGGALRDRSNSSKFLVS